MYLPVSSLHHSTARERSEASRWTFFSRAGALALVLVVVICGLTPSIWAEENRQWRFFDADRVVAVGDVHGAFESLVELLRDAGLISADQRWIGGSTVLVMLGDFVDRGPRSREVLDLIINLQAQAPADGGRVLMVLGNHEVMNLLGDVRYVSEGEYQAFADDEDPKTRATALKRWMKANDFSRREKQVAEAEFNHRFPEGYFAHRAAFAADGYYGRWLLAQHILLVVNDIAYVHGGLAPCLAEIPADEIDSQGMDELRLIVGARSVLEQTGVIDPESAYTEQREAARRHLRRWSNNSLPRMQDTVGAAKIMVEMNDALVVRTDGPLWYRGSSLNPVADEQQVVSGVLEHLGARSAVVGHTPSHTGRVAVRFSGKVVMADTGMLTSHYKGRASAVVNDLGSLYAFYPGEGLSRLQAAAPPAEVALWAAATELESVLGTARVLSVEDVGSGVTQPQRLLLEHQGDQVRAIFKTVDSREPGASGLTDELGCEHEHRYQHEVAAYRVDRLLGLGLVPPTVIRQIDEATGSVQAWVEDAISETNRRDEDLGPEEPHRFDQQVDRVRIFDVLIHNPDRNSTNMLWTTHDWKPHLIDNSAAFAAVPGRPACLEGVNLRLDLDIVNRLLSLDAESLHRELDGLLSDEQIDAILARRDSILDPWRKQPKGTGDSSTSAAAFLPQLEMVAAASGR